MATKSDYRIRSTAGSERPSPMVRFYWQMDLRSHDCEISQDLIPSAFLDIIFPLEIGIKVGGSDSVFEEPFLSPILTQGKTISFLKGCFLFGIRLEAVPGAGLVECSPAEFEQAPNDLVSVLRRPVRKALCSIIYDLPSFEARVAALDKYFLGADLSSRRSSAELCHAALEFINRNPQAKVGDICDRSGYSARWIERVFDENLGCAPKTVIRIVRLNRFLESMKKRPQAKLTDLAYDAGYYDQSHLVREFRRFANLSPSEFGRNYPHFAKIMNHI